MLSIYNCSKFSFYLLKKFKVNNQITAPELRVTDETGQQVGVMSLGAALKLAQEKGLDLIEVAPTAKPPVARIMDYGKYTYREEKEERKQKAKQKKDTLKTVRISLNAGINDLKTKAEKAEGFLKEGLKVQVELLLKGRAKYHKTFADLGKQKVEDFLNLITVPIKMISELKRQPKGFNVTIVKQ